MAKQRRITSRMTEAKPKLNKDSVNKLVKKDPTIKRIGKFIWKCFKKLWGYAVLASAAITFYFNYNKVSDETLSSHDKYIKENYVHGLLMPDVIEDPNAFINIKFGTFNKYFSIAELHNGVEYKDKTIGIINKNRETEYPFEMKFLLKNQRIYIDANFIDIGHRQDVGKINYFTWSLFKPNLIDWHETKVSLEVQDKSGYLVFNMKYIGSSTIQIKGYWVGKETIYVINEQGLLTYPFTDYEEAISSIEMLKPDAPFEMQPQ